MYARHPSGQRKINYKQRAITQVSQRLRKIMESKKLKKKELKKKRINDEESKLDVSSVKIQVTLRAH